MQKRRPVRSSGRTDKPTMTGLATRSIQLQVAAPAELNRPEYVTGLPARNLKILIRRVRLIGDDFQTCPG